MALKAALTINDGQATPVAHTFSPRGPVEDNGVQMYEDRVGGIAIGFPTVAFQFKMPSNSNAALVSSSNRVYRITFGVAVPVMEVTSPQTGTGIQPAPTVSYILRSKTEFWIPERATLAQRKDLLAYTKNGLANAVVTTGVESLEGVWG